MHKHEFPNFGQMIDDCYALLGKPSPSGTAKAMFFRALAQFSLSEVQAGLDAHIKDPQRGRFPPLPADVIEQISGKSADDGRPGPDEAWAMCCRASDESETVVWSEEMSQAYAVACPLMQEGDQIAARMAFKEAYWRMVEDARRVRRPVSWTVSLGHDPGKRQTALQAAETRGLIGHEDVKRLSRPTTNPQSTVTLLLENASKAADPETVKQRVAALKAMMQKKEPANTADDTRAELERKKREADEAIKAYEANK
jgi:hypothetical protein